MKYLTLIFLLIPLAAAANPPTSAQVKAAIQNHWDANEIQELDTYITNLYASYPDYVPAILASSFHDAVFLGKLANARAKLVSIQTDISNYPIKYDDDFSQNLKSMIKQIDYEIAMHSRNGTSDAELETNASASLVRSTWGSESLQNIEIIDEVGSVSLGS